MALKLRQQTSPQPILGVSLDELLARNGQPSTEAPRILSDLVLFLKKRKCITFDKIFVAQGDDVTIQLLKKLYTRDGTVDLDKYYKSAASVAAFLKTLLVELPDSLLTKRLAATFLKTHSNPDREKRLQFLKKLVGALPAVNKSSLGLILDLLRAALVHRNKNRLSVQDLCVEWGPVLVGSVDRANASAVQDSVDLLKTLIGQRAYLLGQSEEPTQSDDIPVAVPKRKATARSTKRRTGSSKAKDTDITLQISAEEDSSESESVSEDEDDRLTLMDGLMSLVLNGTIDNLLFDPRVRVSYAYEPKIPPNVKSQYSIDKIVDSVLHGPQPDGSRSRSGSRVDVLKEEVLLGENEGSSAGSSPRGSVGGPRTPRRLSVSSTGDDIGLIRTIESDSPRSRSPGHRHVYTKSKSMEKLEARLNVDKKMHLNVAAAQTQLSKTQRIAGSPPGSGRNDALDEPERSSARESSSGSKLTKRASTGRVSHKARSAVGNTNASVPAKKSKSERDLHANLGAVIQNRDGRSSTLGDSTSAADLSSSSEPNTPSSSLPQSSELTAEPLTDDPEETSAEQRASKTKTASGKLSSSSHRSTGRERPTKEADKSKEHSKDTEKEKPRSFDVDKDRPRDSGRVPASRRPNPKRISKHPDTPSSEPILSDLNVPSSLSSVAQNELDVPSSEPAESNMSKPKAPLDLPQSSIGPGASVEVLTSELPNDTSLKAQYEKLWSEKKDLQLRLNHFKDEFVRKTGRKIMYEQDKAEVQKEYDRYKEVKILLAQLEPRLASAGILDSIATDQSH